MLASAGILFPKMNWSYELVDEYFYTDSYKEFYEHPIIPFPMPDSIDDEGIIIRPPSTNAWEAEMKEDTSQGEKIPRKMKCGKCGVVSNHNKNTCRSAPA